MIFLGIYDSRVFPRIMSQGGKAGGKTFSAQEARAWLPVFSDLVEPRVLPARVIKCEPMCWNFIITIQDLSSLPGDPVLKIAGRKNTEYQGGFDLFLAC